MRACPQAKRFCRLVSLTAVSVYGGSGVGEQIRELKRGAEAVVCTPGRFIDVLVTGYAHWKFQTGVMCTGETTC